MVDAQDNRARFRVEPLQKGFGITIGNSLRRVMLSSIAGAAVIGVKIDGIEHEYSNNTWCKKKGDGYHFEFKITCNFAIQMIENTISPASGKGKSLLI